MDPNRDNPFIRFSAFWLGLGIVLIFALVLGIFAWTNRDTPDGLEELVAQERYLTKKMVDNAQAEEIDHQAVAAAIPKVAQTLASSSPVAVEKPEQVVPGSATAQKLAEVPPVDTSAVDEAPVEEGPIDPAVMELGKQKFITCTACHGQQGEGGPIGPPLAGSEWVTGPISNLIRIQLRGLTGPITVKGVEYNFPAPMAALSYQTDEEIAAVLTYVRNSFGNKATAVTPEQVKALRSEVGKPMLTVEDLIQP